MESNFYKEQLSVSGLSRPMRNTEQKFSFPKLPGEYEQGFRINQLQSQETGAAMTGSKLKPYRPGKPFYMLAAEMNDEQGMLQELDYLKRMYPEIVRGYMDRVSEILDKLDYEGSMIYDEYPDIYYLKRLAETIVAIIRSAEQLPDGAVPLGPVELPTPESTAAMPEIAPEEMVGTVDSEDKWVWIEYLIQLLVSMEVFRRRNRKSRYY